MFWKSFYEDDIQIKYKCPPPQVGLIILEVGLYAIRKISYGKEKTVN